MGMRLYDTARGEVVPFEPGPTASIYVCGITPYDATHLGHAFTYLTFDLVVRRLEDLGHEVRMVRNVTDVDDSILAKARELDVDHLELAAREMELFHSDLAALDLRPATAEPTATGSIDGMLDLIGHLNREHLAGRDFDDRLAARVNAYELAFRMQSAAPEIVDISRETEATRRLYGIGQKETNEFGTRCLLARRMVEKGVRFVQLYSGDTGGWDAHKDVLQNHSKYCRRTDLPIAGLLKDLKTRGMLDDTLVIWGGEFGRMPMSEQGTGRDHNPWGHSVWLAGAGVRGGMAYGATDPVGLRAEQNKVHVHDLHATILHLLGINHKHLTIFHNGRDERLTDVGGSVVTDILA